MTSESHAVSQVQELGTVRRRISVLLADSTLDVDRRYGVLVASSELLTNALVHARPPVAVRVVVTPTSVEVRVSDEDPRLPTLRAADPHRIGGHGLRLVEAMADAWGTAPTPEGGKEVWFRFDADAR